MTRLRSFGWLLALVVVLSLPALAADTLSIVIDDGATYTTSRAVDIVLTYEGEEVPTQMRVFPSESGDWSEWTEYSTSLEWTLYGDEGTKTLTVETKYWAGLGWRIRSADASIVYDATAPEIVAILPDANASGWYTQSVPIRFEATDKVSGVTSVTDPTTLDTDGAGQSVTGYAKDAAGNTTSVVVRNINIDAAAPEIVAVITPDPNAAGWYSADVTITFVATDSVSGVASVTTPTTFAFDGERLTLTGRATDAAGNESSLIVRNINIDTAAPTLSALVDPGTGSGVWTPGPVSVRFEAADGLSGIELEPTDVTFSMDGGGLSATGKAIDVAGNVTELVVENINIDHALPSTTVVLTDEDADLAAKLEAFGTYDRDDIAVGMAFAGSDRHFTLTILAYDEATEKYSTVVAFEGCEYAATSGLYHATLPMDRLVSGDTYEIWFEEIGGDEETVTILITVP